MIRTNSLYETCHQLFAEYPLAVEAADGDGGTRSMVLMLQNDTDAEFFVLQSDPSHAQASFSLFPWRAAGIAEIGPCRAAVSDLAASALGQGVPIPRNGSLFGWVCDDAVNALVGIRARYTPEYPLPSWAVMPLAGSPAERWPPFTGERLLGNWFWEYYRAREIVLLDALIARTSQVVFWVDARAVLGADCCVVARDIRSTEGYTLPRGCYVYDETLASRRKVPPPDVLLADPGKTDLAPVFAQVGDHPVTDDG